MGFTGDGNKLAKEAEAFMVGDDDLYWGLFVGKISGIADAHFQPFSGNHAICYPKTSTANQLARITARWLDEHPEHLHEEGHMLVFISHIEAFGYQSDPTCWMHDKWLEYNS